MSTARNGDIALAYDVQGSGPDLLLITGTASTRAIWQLVREGLAESYRTIAFDNRDSGESSMAGAPYTLEDLAADALAVLDDAGSTQAHLLGHSLGGAIAQRTALSYPQRCRSLTLVSSWARADDYSRNAIGLLKALSAGVADDRTLLAAIIFIGAGTTTLSECDLWEKADVAMQMGGWAPREALARQWQLDLDVDTIDDLGELRCPAHVVWCNEDRLLPQPLSSRMFEAIPNAAETRIDACGHVPMVDAPEDFLAAVLGFLDKSPGSG